jgi:probable rRNA maturation factor
LQPGKLKSRLATERTTMLEIAIADRQSKLEFNEAILRRGIRQVLVDARIEQATISVAIVDEAAMHELNRRFLRHDYPTDVLSFVLEKSDSHLDGEVIASAEYAITSARDYGWPAEYELLLYVIHGCLHLVGYDDTDDDSRHQMRAAEADCLRALGIAPPDARPTA